MKQFGTFFFLIMLFLFLGSVFSQESPKIDSLKKELNQAGKGLNKRREIINQLSQSYYEKEKYVQAIRLKKEEIKVYQLLKKDSLVAESKIDLAICYFQVGDYDLSMRFYLEALTYFEEHNYSKTIAEIFNSLGVIHQNLENHQKSLAHFLASKQYYEKDIATNMGNFSRLYNNIGNAYLNLEKLDSALYSYKKAMYFARDKEPYDSLSLARIFNNTGEVYFSMDNYEKAYTYYQKSYDLSVQLNDKIGLGATLANMANVKSKKGDDDGAISFYTKSIIFFEEIGGRLFYLIEVNKLLSNIYRKKGDYEQALHHQGLHLGYKDSLQSLETAQNITGLEMQYKG